MSDHFVVKLPAVVIAQITSCARGDTMPSPRPLIAHYGLPPIHSLHALSLQRPSRLRHQYSYLRNYVHGVVHTNQVVTWKTDNDCCLVTLTFELLTLKLVSKLYVTWATYVSILISLWFAVLDL